GRCEELYAQSAAARKAKDLEQKARRHGQISQTAKVIECLSGQVRGADFPATAVEAGLETQPPDPFAGRLPGVGVSHMPRAAIEVACFQRIDHRERQALALALRQQLVRHNVAFADNGELLIEQTGRAYYLHVAQACLAGMQRPPQRRAS